MLTTAPLDHTPENCDPANLRAMCQGCHLHYDRDHHAQTRKATRGRELAAAMDALPGLEYLAVLATVPTIGPQIPAKDVLFE